MFQYSMIQWLFFFYLYCFLGWCFESTYVSIRKKQLTNRGFLRGPFLPIYGSGAIMMLIVSMPFQDNIVLTYLAGCVGATALEYVTGVTMETLFKVRYWDYSDQKFNFQGHICLGSTIAWGFFTILMTEVIQVRVEKIVFLIPGQVLTWITLILTAGIGADMALSFKAAFDLRDVLIKMEQVKEEMARIQKRLDVIIAVVGEEVGQRKEGFAENIAGIKSEIKTGISGNLSDMTTAIEEKLSTIRNYMQTKPGAALENVKEEWYELKEKYTVTSEHAKRIGSLKDFFQRDMIRSNPSMTSTRFKSSLEELKTKVFNRKQK